MDISISARLENEERVAEEYLSSLSDLNCNSKPLINMLTMLAEENIEYAPVIVKVVEQHIAKVPPEFKLPILYLIDSIVKNVKSTYVQLFGQCIVNIFCGAFEKVNEKIRERMYALRQTWNEVFSAQKLYALDVKVKCLDHNWPITAKQPSIHVNPNFLKANVAQAIPTEMEKILQDKTRELLELKKRKLELELEATKKHLEEQEKQFSKTAETVMPPVEALVAANVGMQAPSMATQMMNGLVPPGYMRGPPGNIAVNPAMRPTMFHPNMRGFRPNLHPNMMNMPVQANMMQGGGMPAANLNANLNKPKVHPVNPALLNSVRQRDPRLQRQQQQQQQQRQQQMQQNQNGDRTLNKQQNVRSSQRENEKDKHDNNHKSSRKSPTRMSNNNRSSGGSSNRGSSKNSQRDKDRERERDRKRSESKSSTTSSSSSGSTTNNERKKGGLPKSSEKHQQSSKCDKDAFEIAPLSTAFKRKSNSPLSSPSKMRDSKRSASSSHRSSSKTRSRSRSPDDNKVSTSSKMPYGDIDLRRPTSSSSTSSSSLINSPDKRNKLIATSTTDSEMVSTTSNLNNDKKEDVTKLTSTTVTSNTATDQELDKTLPSPSVASTTAVTTATSSVVSTLSNSNRIRRESVQDIELASKEENNQIVSKDNEEDVKKRPLPPVKDEEPLAKKSKSAKIDALFGSEDVDLRQLIPPAVSAPTALPDDDIPPPPPSIKIDNDLSRDTNENWDNPKTEVANKNSMGKTAKSSLDDVRAKLAKTAKLSKLSKLDKLTRDIDHRNKLSELQMNDDTQEANDEKIRAMITQAQELLESNSINQEQYKHLIKTVMSINETNKLKEAKRRESLNAIKQKLTANIEAANEVSNNDSSTERNLAMQKILKKRIPKLNKGQMAASNEQDNNADTQQQQAEDKQQDEVADKPDSSEEPVGVAPAMPQTSASRAMRGLQREKRGPKVSKWGERVLEPPTASSNMPMGAQQRPWSNIMGNNKRGGGMPPFRGNGPQNMRSPWPMSGAGGVGGNINNMSGPSHGPHHFDKNHMGNMRGNNMPRSVIPPPPQAPPPVLIPKPCNSIDNPQEDLVRTITIDGAAKEIRFYDQVAIVFMEVDQPREIGFQNGQRSIFIDNNEPVTLHFNDGYKTVQIDGETFNLRFGFPSRELYIDDHWYEIYFGGPPISVPIRNTIHMLKAEGPPPQVNIGPLRRDLVVGKINMIVDAHNVIPLFLDARMQTFKLGDTEHTLQFADNLLTVLLNGSPTRVEYGGLPKSLFLGGTKYFVRFGALPQGVVAGKVLIKDMLYVETKPPSEEEIQNETLAQTVAPSAAATTAEINPVELQNSSAAASVPILPAASLSNINIDELFQKLVSTGILGGSSGILPAVSDKSAPNTTTPTNTAAAEEVPPPAPPVHLDPIKPVDLSKPESIKTRQAAIVESLFSGMQCSSCGVRFPFEQTLKYTQHLDWHFRQNRRERDSSRKANARKWYFKVGDWKKYKEIEDSEDQENNFFETQQNDLEIMDEASNQRSTNSPIPTCPAGADDVDRACDMCQEKFEQFYDNELEEWHLRCAIRIEDKIYHPLCYEDYKASLNPPAPPAVEEEETPAIDNEISLIHIEDDNAVDMVIKVEEDKKLDESTEALTVDVDDDEDDDVIVLPNEEPSVTEIVDDDDEDEYVPANVTREHMGTSNEEEGEHNETTESDVEIQEPNIPFTDLDTYIEKDLPEAGDNASKMSSFMNVKIKEEPKEDDDEDDGFEEVGTVVQAPEEISLNSSEDTQTQTIDSSNTALSPLNERPPSATPPCINLHHIEDLDSQLEPPTTDLNISMDGNIETGDEHNLSAAGLVPTVPLASLVNKIKINITKNTVTTSSNTSSNNATALSTMSSNSLNQTDSLGHAGGAAANSSVSNPIPTISTIPVLCGGGTTISSIVGGSGVCAGGDYDDYSAVDELRGNSVSTISVIGSYGSTVPTITHLQRPVTATVVATQQPPKPATPPPVEETITYELKPVLQKANLKKKEKVICGNETSGLCSIM